jgi:hypothetical protein
MSCLLGSDESPAAFKVTIYGSMSRVRNKKALPKADACMFDGCACTSLKAKTDAVSFMSLPSEQKDERSNF